MNQVPEPGAGSELRDRILDAAYHLVTTAGWARLRMSHIAKAADVTRAAVHDTFPSLDAVGRGLIERETERFLHGIVAELSKHRDDLGRSTAAGVGFALRLAAENPLLKSLIASDTGQNRALLTHLTTRSEAVFDSAYNVVAAYVEEAWPGVTPERRRLMVDAVVRMTISHIVAPSLPPSAATDDIAAIAVYIAGTRGGDPGPRTAGTVRP
ncbi:TetR family transcriptional regulator [Streptomyces sp. bgisy100]|uniref:TetR family transcriptional regulator n=1 Tax=Streptomyces sp. bgisy100 TaxID=3413783 RepID=UPI003D72D136